MTSPYFRYAFLELSEGKHPDVAGWVTRKAKHHALSRVLGEMPHGLALAGQTALAGVLAQASLRQIASLASFPDWLGYLGLALRYTSGVEPFGRRLTKAWVPQLRELCPSDTAVVGQLQAIHDDESRVLRWGDLESVETAVDVR